MDPNPGIVALERNNTLLTQNDDDISEPELAVQVSGQDEGEDGAHSVCQSVQCLGEGDMSAELL